MDRILYLFLSSQGQTLGMRAWRLVVVNERGKTSSPLQCFLRWFFAIITCMPFGFGLWWQFHDSRKRTLYDVLSRTHLNLADKNPYQS